MSRTTLQGKGSKRKVELIRWRHSERFSLLLLLLVLVIETIGVAWWLMTHHID
jgi:hypothetical protein